MTLPGTRFLNLTLLQKLRRPVERVCDFHSDKDHQHRIVEAIRRPSRIRSRRARGENPCLVWRLRSTVILEFPTMDAARAWYHSEAYAEILPLRLNGADYSGILVEGI
ncbi:MULTISPECIES: DUF1330 domain-containing protein [Mycobacterium simiae complex]